MTIQWSNLLKWSWKDLWWLLFFIFLIISAYAYKKDVGLCQEFMQDECVLSCMTERYVSNLPPGVTATCDSEGNCLVSGVGDVKMFPQVNISNINITK